jgi:hypothetical protein
MSLNLNEGKIIANLYNSKDKILEKIYYDDDENDEIPEHKKLKQLRVNDTSNYFFPDITDFKETEQTERVYVSGESGVGKSTFMKQYVLKFIQKFPKSPILLFSSKLEDKQLDTIKKINRVNIDDDIFNNPYTLNEISGGGSPTLCIFDDVEDFKTKKITQEIARLRDEILRNGRSYGIYALYCNHNPCDYKNTRNQFFEANKIVIFPKRSGQGTYNYLMDKKLLLNKETIDKVNNLKSNFVCINKQFPKSIISDKYILLL